MTDLTGLLVWPANGDEVAGVVLGPSLARDDRWVIEWEDGKLSSDTAGGLMLLSAANTPPLPKYALQPTNWTGSTSVTPTWVSIP